MIFWLLAISSLRFVLINNRDVDIKREKKKKK